MISSRGYASFTIGMIADEGIVCCFPLASQPFYIMGTGVSSISFFLDTFFYLEQSQLVFSSVWREEGMQGSIGLQGLDQVVTC